METIVDKFMLQLESQLAERHVAITLTAEARALAGDEGLRPACSARGRSARVIQKEVRDPLTDQILFGALEHGGTVTIGVADNQLTFAYEGAFRPRRAAAPTSSRRRQPTDHGPARAGHYRNATAFLPEPWSYPCDGASEAGQRAAPALAMMTKSRPASRSLLVIWVSSGCLATVSPARSSISKRYVPSGT